MHFMDWFQLVGALVISLLSSSTLTDSLQFKSINKSLYNSSSYNVGADCI